MLKEGDKAPKFDLESDRGDRVKLADLLGKWSVVYFYPKNDTPGCTREAIAFTGAKAKLAALGASVFGISKDTCASHGKFRDKYKLGVTLLSDPGLVAHKAFGAFGMKKMYGRDIEGTIRSTFLVSPDGKIARVFPSVKVDGHDEQVLAALRELTGKGGGAAAKGATAPAKKTGTVAKKAAARKIAGKARKS